MNEREELPDLDLDEDLFDFDEVAREAGSTQELTPELDLLGRPGLPAEELFAVPELELAGPASSPGGDADRTTPAALAAEDLAASEPLASGEWHGPADAADTEEALASAAPARRRPRLSRSVLAIALSITCMNALAALVVLHRRTDVRDEVRATGRASVPQEPDPGASSSAAREPEPATDPAPPLSAPDLATALAEHPVPVQAREEIARGEYAAARQRLYSLLSIIDRLEEPRREELEAECQFLIAQSLHLEALEHLGRAQ